MSRVFILHNTTLIRFGLACIGLCISGATKSYIILLHYVAFKFGLWSDWEIAGAAKCSDFD